MLEQQPLPSSYTNRYENDQYRISLFTALEKGRWFEDGDDILTSLRLDKPAHEAFQELMVLFTPLVYSIADKKKNAHHPLKEVVGWGYMGLAESLARFTLTKGADFTTFAYQRVDGYLHDQFRKMGLSSSASGVSIVRNIEHMNKVIDKLTTILNREPSELEIAYEMDMTLKEVKELFVAARKPVRLDSPCPLQNDSGDEFSDWHDFIPDQSDSPENQVIANEEVGQLQQALAKLSGRERFIILTYEFNGYTLKEIGQMLNLSESRVCQIYNKGINQAKLFLQNIE